MLRVPSGAFDLTSLGPSCAELPGERDRILKALRESFPSRYRQLVELYYEELAKKAVKGDFDSSPRGYLPL